MKLRDIIIKYRTENGLSQRQFAAKCNDITNGYISIIEADYNPHTKKQPHPSVEKLTSIAQGMGLTFDQLMDMINDKPPRPAEPAPRLPANAIPYTPGRAMVPIVGVVRCGPGGLAYEDMQGVGAADVANQKEYFFLRVEGDSMAPAIEAGDIALIHIQPEVENGQLAVVIIDGEEGMLKKFMREGNTVILQSFNSAYAPRVLVGEEINTMCIAGKVVETRKSW